MLILRTDILADILVRAEGSAPSLSLAPLIVPKTGREINRPTTQYYLEIEPGGPHATRCDRITPFTDISLPTKKKAPKTLKRTSPQPHCRTAQVSTTYPAQNTAQQIQYNAHDSSSLDVGPTPPTPLECSESPPPRVF